MESRKKILTALFVFIAVAVSAQPIVESRKGNVRSQGNLAGGYLFSQKAFGAYLAGDLDVFIDDHVSITGAGWYGFKLTDNESGLLHNHAIFSGFNYHPMKKGRWDPFIGISPGVGITQVRFNDSEGISNTTTGLAPLVSGEVGCNYYVGSVFNFFVKARGITGHFRGDAPSPVALNEIKLTAGLGWNFKLWSK